MATPETRLPHRPSLSAVSSIHADRGAHPLAAYIRQVESLVSESPSNLACRVARATHALVSRPGWLTPSCCEPGDDTYRRHLLHADPQGRFTVLSVVWRPGQGTPVHGHTAWGAVGVYQGMPSVALYRCCDQHRPMEKDVFCCSPGDVSYVVAGIEEPHRVFNASEALAITIHTYGRDLRDDPAGINILL